MKQLITSLLFCLPVLFTFSQEVYEAEEFQAALLQTKTGAILVYTGDNHSFTLQIDGEIEPNEVANFLTLDKKILQIMNVPFNTKQNFEKMSLETQKQNLLGHMKYELDYFKEIFDTKNLNETAEFVTLNDKLFLLWTYTMPKLKSKTDPKSKKMTTVEKQSYLTTICFDQILLINKPIEKAKESEEAKAVLFKIGKTLVLNNFTIDLEKLYNELNK